jgi:predicted nucleotidyltransferase component of viral defense system
VLKRISLSAYKDILVFKGGTALAKALHIINRFSEDIDLALIPQNLPSGNQLKELLRNIEKAITVGLTEEIIAGFTNKGSRFRKSIFKYPKMSNNEEFGIISDKLLVEINTLSNPFPFQPKPIKSFIAEYLNDTNKMEFVKKYELEEFYINTLSIERTLVEKIFALVRASYDLNYERELKNRIRHLYDIHLILKNKSIKSFICTEDFRNMINEIRAEDVNNEKYIGEWINRPISEARFFSDIDISWELLKESFVKKLSVIIIGDMPKSEDVYKSLVLLKNHLKDY